MADGRLIYWDACNFISYVNGVPDRLPHLDALLEESQQDDIKIVTSTLSIAEVAFSDAERKQGVLSEEAEAQIDALFGDREVVRLIEFHEGIAREARRLMRLAITRNQSLKPYDAVHLGSALSVPNITEFQTYDGGLDKYADDLRFPVRRPMSREPRFPLTEGKSSMNGSSE